MDGGAISRWPTGRTISRLSTGGRSHIEMAYRKEEPYRDGLQEGGAISRWPTGVEAPYLDGLLERRRHIRMAYGRDEPYLDGLREVSTISG